MTQKSHSLVTNPDCCNCRGSRLILEVMEKLFAPFYTHVVVANEELDVNLSLMLFFNSHSNFIHQPSLLSLTSANAGNEF